MCDPGTNVPEMANPAATFPNPLRRITMAYNNKNAASNKAAAPGTNQGENFTKANAFMNIYYVQPNGKKYKIGNGVPFYDHKPRDLQIKDWLLVTGKDEAETAKLRNERLEKFLNMITIDFVEVTDETMKLELPE
jgi:hypothetical protein